MEKRVALTLSLAGLAVIGLLGSLAYQPKLSADSNGSLPTTELTHPLTFFERESFDNGISYAAEHKAKLDYRAAGGIVPHHLLPGFILADFYQKIAAQKPKTIILIGPNHYEKGSFKALSSQYGWETPFGVAHPNQAIINDLVTQGLVKIDESVVAGDHSTAGSMPFIKYYLPDTQVVPIILSAKMSLVEIDKLANRLQKYVDTDTVLVAPVDFSHYLSADQAEANDKITLAAMKAFDYDRLLAMNNDYLDSPVSIVTLLKVMKGLKKTNLELLNNTNSGILLHDRSIETTSYFSILFH